MRVANLSSYLVDACKNKWKRNAWRCYMIAFTIIKSVAIRMYDWEHASFSSYIKKHKNLLTIAMLFRLKSEMTWNRYTYLKLSTIKKIITWEIFNRLINFKISMDTKEILCS